MRQDEIVATAMMYLQAADLIFNTPMIKDGKPTGRNFGQYDVIDVKRRDGTVY